MGEPVVLVQADASGEGEIRTDSNEHRSPLGILQIEVILIHPAILGLQMPLVRGSNSRHDARWFARLADHTDLVRLGIPKVRLDEFVAAACGRSHDLCTPLL